MRRPTMIRAASDIAADRARALALTPVSRETEKRLDQMVELLLAWQRTTQLVANSTLSHVWTRHIADSLQLLDLAPAAGCGWTSAPARIPRPRRCLRTGRNRRRKRASGRKQCEKGRIPARSGAPDEGAGRGASHPHREIRGKLRPTGRCRYRTGPGSAKAVAGSKLCPLERRGAGESSPRDKM